MFEKLVESLEKLHIEDGDILVSRGLNSHEVNNLIQILQDHVEHDVAFINIPLGTSLQLVPEEDMNEIGWYRRDES